MAATDEMVKGVDFVAFQTKDFSRAMTFYGETLGLPRAVHMPDRGFAERALPQAIFTGFLNGEDLAAAYASSDLFVFPSDSESFGNVTLEAMASGLPCVCADATGSRSLVVFGQTGYLAPAVPSLTQRAHPARELRGRHPEQRPAMPVTVPRDSEVGRDYRQFNDR